MALVDYLLKGSLNRNVYKGRDGREYMFGIYRHVIDANDTIGTDRLYIMYNDGGSLQIIGKYNFSAIKGGNKYTYDTLNGAVYISSRNLYQAVNGVPAGVFYFYIDETSTFHSGFLANSPAADFIRAAKNRLFTSGVTTNFYSVGAVTLTNGSPSVTVSKHATTNRARADNIATLTLNASPPFNYKVGDVVRITLSGGTGYNDDSAELTAIDSAAKTISYNNTGANENSAADTACRVEPDFRTFIKPGDMINVGMPYAFTVSGIADANRPSAGQTYTSNSSTFTVIMSSLVLAAGTYSGTIFCTRSSGTNEPSASGTLTKGTAPNDVTFSAVAFPNPMSYLPGFWFEVKNINNDNSLTLISNYTGYTSLIGNYVIKRYRNNATYHSAEEPIDSWINSSIIGGDISGIILTKEPTTGIGIYDDAVILFNKNTGNYIDGTNIADWSVPKRTRLPVGCISHDSIVSKDNWLGFMSDKGYYITNSGALRFDDLQAKPFSDIIQKTIDDIDFNVAENIFAYVYKQFLLLSVCSKSVYQGKTDTEQLYSTGTLSCSTVTYNKTSDYTLTETSGNVIVNVDTSGGNITITLPTAVGNKAIYKIVKTSASNNLYIAAAAGCLVLGVPTYTTATANNTIVIIKADDSMTIKKWVLTNANSVLIGLGTSWVGNVQNNDLIEIGDNTYIIKEVVNDTTMIIDQLISDQVSVTYVVVKRRNNRLLVLDSRTNVKRKSFGWTVFDNVNVDSFCELDKELYYASSTSSLIYRYDIGGTLYGGDIPASFTTMKNDCRRKGVIKYFKIIHQKIKGVGRAYVTPIIDGVAKDQMAIDVDTDVYKSFYFPNALCADNTLPNYPRNDFSGRGESIQLLIECNGSNETLAFLPPEYGTMPQHRGQNL